MDPPLEPAAPRLTLRYMLGHPARIVALGFGSGLSPVAPGTAGTLFAWAAYDLLLQRLPTPLIGAVIVLSLLVGWWACTRTAGELRVLDPGNIVWDEVAAFWLVLWLVLPAGWPLQVAAFALFRGFDMVKAGPVGWADRAFHGFGWRGGFGIMLDDVVAAFCALLVIAAWRFWW